MDWNLANDILGIIGFILTIFTLVATTKIKRKLSVMTDKNQYRNERNEYKNSLNNELSNINKISQISDAIPVIMRINSTVSSIISFDIWKPSDKEQFNNFLSYSRRVQTNIIAAQTNNTNTAVRATTPSKDLFITEYVDKLSSIIAIVRRDSSVE